MRSSTELPVGRAVFGAGTAAVSDGIGVQAHTFTHGDPDQVLTTLRTLDLAAALDREAGRHQTEALADCEKRRAQIAYAELRAQGSPIGSGAVESANTLVVEARLKGRGMPGDRASVSPRVSLRALLWSHRWSAAAHLACPPGRVASPPSQAHC